MKKKIFSLFIFFIVVSNLQAQENRPEITDVITRFFEESAGHAAIYSGKEHLAYPYFYEEHPFLETDEYKEGSIFYDGVYYPSVFMKLDLYTGELVAQTPDKRYNTIVPYDKVEFVDLHSYSIFYHYPDRDKSWGSPPAGYYLQLHSGDGVVVLQRSFATLESRIEDNMVKYKFHRKNRFYILKDGVYYPVRTMAGVWKIFKPYNRQLKEYAKKNKLDLKKDPQRALTTLAKQYETLK